MTTEEKLEEAYWNFDGDKRGYGERLKVSERDAFKKAVRTCLAHQKKNIAKLVIDIDETTRE